MIKLRNMASEQNQNITSVRLTDGRKNAHRNFASYMTRRT